jgi:hypothetical protein
MDKAFLYAGPPLALALIVALYLLHAKVDTIPLRILRLVQKEGEQNGPKALDAMREAVASRAGTAVVAIRQYEAQIAASYRAQIAEAEVRARQAERRAADTTTALQTALSLVGELRAVLDTVGPALVRRVPRPAAAEPPVESPLPPRGDDVERRTIEIAPASPGDTLPSAVNDGDDLGDDEKTRVGKRPGVGAS